MAEPLQFQWDASSAEAASLVAQRNLPFAFLDDATAEDIEVELQKLSHVRLDKEQLKILQPSIFHILPNLTNLYLHKNELINLEALENAKKLRFLTIANNRITCLKGLSSLLHLVLLDVSNNSISHIDVDSELPKFLSFLNIRKNPCYYNQNGLFQKLKLFLPNLKDFDWKEETYLLEDKISDDDDNDDDDNDDNNNEDNNDNNNNDNNSKVDETNKKIHSLKDFISISTSNLLLDKKNTQYKNHLRDEKGISNTEFPKDYKRLKFEEVQKCATSNEETLSLAIQEFQKKQKEDIISIKMCNDLKQNYDQILHRSQDRIFQDEIDFIKLTKKWKDYKFILPSKYKQKSNANKMDARNRPQILQHVLESLNITVYETLWVPCSARFVVLGGSARSTGIMQIYELEGPKIKKLKQSEKHHTFKCGTFGASSLADRHLATGDFKGTLWLWDLERMSMPLWHVKAHDTIINCMDGCGGLNIGYGAPEIVTGGRDGRVRIWDQRQQSDPVMSFEPTKTKKNKNGIEGTPRDCWCVAFGNSYNDEERCVLAGYDNGDIKLFDLCMGKVRWETSLKNGICGIDFDRKDIKMNKFVCTTLESKLHLFDLRTHHQEKGYANLQETLKHGTTVWGIKHLPQNRELLVTLGGDGSVSLYKYHYPDQRINKDGDKKEYGIVGKVELLNNAKLAPQPICCWSWSPDKLGLAVCGSFDQCIRTVVVTKLYKT